MPEIPDAPKPEVVQINFTASKKVLDALKEFAKWHGDRPVRREFELAAECHLTRSMLHALGWPGYVEALQRQQPGLDPDVHRAELEAHLEDLERQAHPDPERIVELLP